MPRPTLDRIPSAPASEAFKNELVGHMPFLFAYAMKLCRNRANADDIAQDAMVQALAYHDAFTMGTDMRAWLCTIARRRWLTRVGRHDWRFVVSQDDGNPAMIRAFAMAPRQERRVELSETLRAIDRLEPWGRDILMLMADGLAYEEAAVQLDVPVGTVKSRVSRARQKLMACA